jgi:prepilin-type N-terminal cleavage/methylation domain-containing protein
MPRRRRAQNDPRFQTPNLKATRLSPSPPLPLTPSSARKGFTLLELLVVIGIIVLLAAILVPVVSQVRMKGYETVTRAQMNRIAAAIQSYYHDFKAYPGPIPNNQLIYQANTVNNIIPDPNSKNPTTITATNITSSENLVLGLFGVLNPPDTAGGQVKYAGFPPPHDVISLNPVRPASYHYIDYIPEELSVPTGSAYSGRLGGGPVPPGQTFNVDALAQGHAGDTSGQYAQQVGFDSAIPEFMDRIPDYMPILYIRANVGVQPQPGVSGSGIAGTPSASNPVQYDATQLKYYGFNNVSTTDYPLPTGVTASGPDAQWVAYFMNPNMVGQPRGKDGFVLISAGPDRLYGTKDDIIVTP